MLQSSACVLAARCGVPAARALTLVQRIGFAAAAGSIQQQPASPPRERLNYDVCIVGAGPAGLSAAIRFKQLCKEAERDFSVCIIEKGSTVGAHVLSGNVFEPTALEELYPGWAAKKEAGEAPFNDLPLHTRVSADRFYLLTQRRALRLPTPAAMRNVRRGNYVISLSELTRWLAARAEEAGVDIFPGFAGKHVLYDWHNAVVGVATGDMGVGRGGSPTARYSPGVDLMARLTLFGEGCRGSLSESLISHYGLREASDACPQTYGLGIKEVWELPPGRTRPGLVVHTLGWPLDTSTYGGGWIYHMDERRVSVGFVTGLDYTNPYISPYEEFQQFKRHPLVSDTLQGGTCLQYGARTLNEGGLQSIPSLAFPGGALLGCSAGLLNVAKIKGTHTAMHSGFLAGEEAYRALATAKEGDTAPIKLSNYQARLEASWAWQELERVRNIRPGFAKWGLWGGMVNAAVTTLLTRGREPWTLKHRRPDHEATQLARDVTRKEYPRPDGEITFDVPTSLFRSGTNHEHDQPPHLVLRDPGLPGAVNMPHYDGPETRYCPAGVYEYAPDPTAGGRPALRINAQNCLHCKACSIKDPRQNITWTVPEGGGGPAYTVM